MLPKTESHDYEKVAITFNSSPYNPYLASQFQM